MKKTIVIVMALALSACANMTPAQKTTAWIVVGVAVAVVATSSSDSSTPVCKPTVGGSGADFDFSCRPNP